MPHELQNSLQHTRTLLILSRLGQALQLIVSRGEHLQPLERRHRQCQIPLRAIQSLDVCSHVGDCLLGLNGSCSHAFDLAEEDGELFLGSLHAREGGIIAGGLDGDEVGDGGGEVILVGLEGVGGLIYGGKGGGVGEDGVEVIDRVIFNSRTLVR